MCYCEAGDLQLPYILFEGLFHGYVLFTSPASGISRAGRIASTRASATPLFLSYGFSRKKIF
ncbi:MAG: hypothetical protein LUQ36_05945, partial [Methanoregula sp.]|nr:hypothetical protein [Methanoregula sp.]